MRKGVQSQQAFQQNPNPNNQSLNYSVPKKPQFYPQQQNNSSYLVQQDKPQALGQKHNNKANPQYSQQVQLKANIEQSNKSVALQKQKYQIPAQSQNVSQHNYKFQTPTNQQHIQVQQQKVVDKQTRKRSKKYKLVVKIIDAHIAVSKTTLFQMAVYVKVKMGDKEEKTSQQKGQDPKWGETFIFENVQQKGQIEFSVYHKPFLTGEEFIGNAIFVFQSLYSYNLNHYITIYDKDREVGNLSVNLNLMKSKSATPGKSGPQTTDSPSQVSNEEDVDEDLINSIDYRDHEISRQLVSNKNTRNRQLQMAGTTDEMVYRKNQYQGLQTQAQIASTSTYLNTQINQPRQSLTENSMIQYQSNSSSNKDSDKINDSKHQRSRHRGGGKRHHHHHHNKHRNHTKQPQQQLFQQQQQAQEEEHIIPQQLLFYGKSHHSNSSNNLLNQQNMAQHQQQKQYQQHSNSQFLYLDDIQYQQQQHQHSQMQKKSQQHNNSKKEKSSKRKEKYVEQQQPMIQVDQFLDELGVNGNDHNDIIEVDEELNYGNYLNQRSAGINHFGGTAISGISPLLHPSGQQTYQQISNSNSQQMLPQFNNKPIGFESGGGTSGSGGTQQMMAMGPNGYNLNPGSNGSQFPMGVPSVFEEQNSLESLNEVDMMTVNNNMILQGNNQNLIPYEPIEYDFQQIQNTLLEENARIKEQEYRLNKLTQKLSRDKEILRQEQMKLRQQKEAFKNETSLISSQLEQRRLQVEKGYTQLKQDQLRFMQNTMLLEELNQKFQEGIKESKILQMAQGKTLLTKEKLDDFITLMKNIYYLTSQLINMQQSYRQTNRAMSGVEEAKIMQHHLQQESTSSCATNSTGNYNFIMQGSTLFHMKSNQSPINNPNKMGGHQMYLNNMSNSHSRQRLISQPNQGDSISPPKQITDIIDTEGELSGGDTTNQLLLDQEQQFRRLSPLNDRDQQDILELERKVKQQRIQAQINGRKGHFVNEQHELSTIIEKEQLTSQRRSSNGGLGAGNGTSNNTADERSQINSTGIAGQNIGLQQQFNPQASAFQMFNNADLSNQLIDQQEEEDSKFITQQRKSGKHDTKQGQLNKVKTNQPHIESQIEAFSQEKKLLDEQKKEYEDRKFQLDELYKNLYDELQQIQQLKQQMINNTNHEFSNNYSQMQIQQQTPQQEQEEELKNDQNEIIITASGLNSVSSVKHMPMHEQNPYENMQQIAIQDFNQEQANEQLEEESMEFRPDPDFLKKINANLAQNDQKFNAAGQVIRPQQVNNFIQNPVENRQNILPQYYNELFGQHIEYDYDDDQEGSSQRSIISQDQYQQIVPRGVGLVVEGDQQYIVDEDHQAIGYLESPISQIRDNMVCNTSKQGQGVQQIADNFGDVEVDNFQEYMDNQDGDNGQENQYGTIVRDTSSQVLYQQQQEVMDFEIAKQTSLVENVSIKEGKSTAEKQKSFVNLILKGKKEKLTDEEIQKLLDQNYQFEDDNDSSVIYYNGRTFDEKKRAIYGIQKSDTNF